jgi:hypothetical protein
MVAIKDSEYRLLKRQVSGLYPRGYSCCNEASGLEPSERSDLSNSIIAFLFDCIVFCLKALQLVYLTSGYVSDVQPPWNVKSCDRVHPGVYCCNQGS